MSPEPPDTDPEAGHAGGPDALDVWLRRELQQRYAAVTAEPIPLELLRLVEEEQKPVMRSDAEPLPQRFESASIVQHGFEQRVRERAYFLWLEEGCPEGRHLEHWMLAFTQQVAQEAHEQAMGQRGSISFQPGSLVTWYPLTGEGGPTRLTDNSDPA